MDEAEAFLAHYGVKGMRWGVRKKRGPEAVQVATPAGRRVQTRGGTLQKASDDAVRAATYRQQAKKSTTDSLSNRELQDLVGRMNLERQYESLRPKTFTEQATAFLSKELVNVGKQEAGSYARGALTDAIKNRG